MTKPQITVNILKRPQVRAQVNQARLSRVAAATLRAEKIGRKVELGLLITDDREMRALNFLYLGHKETTDVLAFPGSDENFQHRRRAPRYLGEVVISYTQVKKQAKEMGQDIHSELDFVFVHGILHLLGYDDHRSQDRQRMWSRQEEILHRVGIKNTR